MNLLDFYNKGIEIGTQYDPILKLGKKEIIFGDSCIYYGEKVPVNNLYVTINPDFGAIGIYKQT